jgi:hypothetical protein
MSEHMAEAIRKVGEHVDQPIVPRETPDRIRERILFLLGHYPVVSHSMLQISLGPNLSPKLWKPVVDELIKEGVLCKEEEAVTSNLGRYQTLVKIRLANKEELVDLQDLDEPIPDVDFEVVHIT